MSTRVVLYVREPDFLESLELGEGFPHLSPLKAIVRYLAVFIAFVAVSPQSNSQTVDKKMEGLQGIEILVENLTRDSRDCGVTKEGLRSAASFPVANSRLRTVDQGSQKKSV